MVLVPVIGTETLAASTNQDHPVEVALPMTYLPLATAPKQWLGVSSGKIDVNVGESRSERSTREAAETRQQLEAKARDLETKRRAVTTRSGDANRSGLSVADALALIEKYAQQYGVSEAKIKAVVGCESQFNQFAKNKNSTASGYGQFLQSTWKSTMRAMGRDINTSPFDAEANLEATAYVLHHQGTTPWNSSRACWSKF